VLLIPRFIGEAADRITHNPGRSVLVGFACGILFPIAILLAAITAIGLPLALMTTAVLLVFGALSEVPVAVWLGQRIMHNRTLLGRQSNIVNFFIGALILLIVGVVPKLGGIIYLVATCIGFGAILLAAWSARERQLT
jgi:hypothetical protein